MTTDMQFKRMKLVYLITQEDLNNVPILPECPYENTSDIAFCTLGVQKVLESIRPDKPCGPAQIPARVLKESAFELAPILASLFQ